MKDLAEKVEIITAMIVEGNDDQEDKEHREEVNDPEFEANERAVSLHDSSEGDETPTPNKLQVTPRGKGDDD
jgi:hypothetical protein